MEARRDANGFESPGAGHERHLGRGLRRIAGLPDASDLRGLQPDSARSIRNNHCFRRLITRHSRIAPLVNHQPDRKDALALDQFGIRR